MEISRNSNCTEGSIPTGDTTEEIIWCNFLRGIGHNAHFQASLHLNKDAIPQFPRPRPVPFALRGHRKGAGSDGERWSSATSKPQPVGSPYCSGTQGQVHICGDFKVTVNSVLKVDQYPLPKLKDLFVILVGVQKFTKLDLSQAYQQVRLGRVLKSW